jgi:hypothetical protein
MLLYILTLNLVAGADVLERWGEEVVAARHAYFLERRKQSARLRQPNCDAQVQVNAFDRVVREQLIRHRRNRLDAAAEDVWELAQQVATKEVRRVARQQQVLRTSPTGATAKAALDRGWVGPSPGAWPSPRRRGAVLVLPGGTLAGGSTHSDSDKGAGDHQADPG